MLQKNEDQEAEQIKGLQQSLRQKLFETISSADKQFEDQIEQLRQQKKKALEEIRGEFRCLEELLKEKQLRKQSDQSKQRKDEIFRLEQLLQDIQKVLEKNNLEHQHNLISVIDKAEFLESMQAEPQKEDSSKIIEEITFELSPLQQPKYLFKIPLMEQQIKKNSSVPALDNVQVHNF